MRKATAILTILASLAFFAFALASPASADPNGPGNNGTVKIHDADTSVEDMRNEPHVCRFYVDGFKFDNNSSGQWWIQSWPPTGDRTEVKRESWKADGKGDWHSGIQTLPNGHYKLFAKQQNEATPGGNKQKVFWVECGSGTTGGTGGGTSTGTTGGTETTTTTSGGGGGETAATTTGPNGIVIFRRSETANSGAVRGFESAPSQNAVGAVSPIVEVPGGSLQQSPNTGVNGVQTAAVAGVQSLPSTSTDRSPSAPLAALGLAIIGLGGALLRRGARA